MFRVKLCWWEPDLTVKEIMLGFLNYSPQCLCTYILYMKCIFSTLPPNLFTSPFSSCQSPLLHKSFHFSFHDVLHTLFYVSKQKSGNHKWDLKNQFFWDWLNFLNMTIFIHTHFPANNIIFFLFKFEKIHCASIPHYLSFPLKLDT